MGEVFLVGIALGMSLHRGVALVVSDEWGLEEARQRQLLYGNLPEILDDLGISHEPAGISQQGRRSANDSLTTST